jgi:hypothetical protein
MDLFPLGPNYWDQALCYDSCGRTKYAQQFGGEPLNPPVEGAQEAKIEADQDIRKGSPFEPAASRTPSYVQSDS